MRTYLEYIQDKSTLLTEAGGVALINILDRLEKIYIETNDLTIKLYSEYISGKLKTEETWVQIGLKTYTARYSDIVGTDYLIDDIGFEKFLNYKDIPLHIQIVPIFVDDKEAIDKIYKMQTLVNMPSGYEDTVRAGVSVFSKTNGNIEEVYIQIPSVNGIIMRSDFYAVALHELQHLFQHYVARSQGQTYLSKSGVELLKYIRKNLKEPAFEDIVYHCLDDDEVEAFVVTVFGEILGAGVESPADLQRFKKNSGVYALIDETYAHLKKIARMSDNEIIKFMEAVEIVGYKDHGLGITTKYRLDWRYTNIDDYREKLLDYCYKVLERMEKRILKVVGTYFTRIKNAKRT